MIITILKVDLFNGYNTLINSISLSLLLLLLCKFIPRIFILNNLITKNQVEPTINNFEYLGLICSTSRDTCEVEKIN